MGRPRKGSIVEKHGRLYVRLVYVDGLGRRRELMRRAENKKHAKELQKELVKQLASAEPGQQRAELDAQKLTFSKAAAYETARLVPAEYSGDIKIRGFRAIPAVVVASSVIGSQAFSRMALTRRDKRQCPGTALATILAYGWRPYSANQR